MAPSLSFLCHHTFSPTLLTHHRSYLTNMPDRQERTGRRRPFSNWVKKLAGFKHAASASASTSNNNDNNNSNNNHGGRNGHHHFRRDHQEKSYRKWSSKNNNPYPQSGRINVSHPVTYSEPSLTTAQTGHTSNPSLIQSRASLRSSGEGGAPPTAGGISMAPTVSTDQEGGHSINAPSHMASSVTGTSRTANGGFESRKGGDSTFSSPAPSVRSLTTTLTTIQSMGPNGALTVNANVGGQHNSHHHHSSSSHHNANDTTNHDDNT